MSVEVSNGSCYTVTDGVPHTTQVQPEAGSEVEASLCRSMLSFGEDEDSDANDETAGRDLSGAAGTIMWCWRCGLTECRRLDRKLPL